MGDKRSANTDTGASPGEFLRLIKRKPVVVKLNSGVDYRGACALCCVLHGRSCKSLCVSAWQACTFILCRAMDACRSAGVLVCLDGYMNIAMEQTEEFVDGQLQNQYGDAFIRGNNVLYISAAKDADTMESAPAS